MGRTCADIPAPSHRQLASREARAMAATAEQRKKNKYAHLEATHYFVPIAIETLGVVGEEGSVFFKDLGRHISIVTLEKSSHQFLLHKGSQWQFSEEMLHRALATAAALSTVEQEGVAASMLPVQAVANKKQEPAKKELPPPTGKKGCALFDFEGQLQKEADLSFNKGAIIDLTHTVNENWLEGQLSQAKGIFPTAYVQVLSHEQLRELLSQEKAPLLHDVVAYDFQSQLQSEKELSFKKGAVIVITKVDANWFEGYISDRTTGPKAIIMSKLWIRV